MNMKRILCTLLALVLCCVSLGGCSTPEVAMTVDGKVYEMGDYLAYMYGTLYTDQQAYMYLYYYGADALSQSVTYGEGDAAEEMTLSEYVVQVTQDNMIRQKAIEDLMKQYGIEWDAELLKEIEEELTQLKADQFLDLGFNNDRYSNMYKAIYLNEASLFTGLYDDGGLREVSDADERKWFDEHYYSYKIVELSLVDSETSKEFSEDETAKIDKQMQGYVDLFNKNGKNSAAFDVVYRQYLKDTAEEAEQDETTTTTEDEAEEELETASRNDMVDESMDENLLKAIKEIAEGEAAVKTYQKNGTTKTMAFILRMDPEAERGKDEDGKEIDYYADCHDQTLQYMKYDELAEEIAEKVKALADKVTVDERAIDAAKPEDMVA